MPLHKQAKISAGKDLGCGSSGRKSPIFNHWNVSCCAELSASLGGKDFGQMEVKIVILLTLIAAIAAAAHVGARGQSQERAN
jgi:hypothetical protein